MVVTVKDEASGTTKYQQKGNKKLLIVHLYRLRECVPFRIMLVQLIPSAFKIDEVQEPSKEVVL